MLLKWWAYSSGDKPKDEDNASMTAGIRTRSNEIKRLRLYPLNHRFWTLWLRPKSSIISYQYNIEGQLTIFGNWWSARSLLPLSCSLTLYCRTYCKYNVTFINIEDKIQIKKDLNLWTISNNGNTLCSQPYSNHTIRLASKIPPVTVVETQTFSTHTKSQPLFWFWSTSQLIQVNVSTMFMMIPQFTFALSSGHHSWGRPVALIKLLCPLEWTQSTHKRNTTWCLASIMCHFKNFCLMMGSGYIVP